MKFIVSLSWSWPWISFSHLPPILSSVATTAPHRAWVKTERGYGWIHHHEKDGFVIQLVDGTLFQTNDFQHARK